MAGASSSAKARALFSEAAEAIIASAAAWSLEEGAGAPMVCQAEDLALRNSEVRPETVAWIR